MEVEAIVLQERVMHGQVTDGRDTKNQPLGHLVVCRQGSLLMTFLYINYALTQETCIVHLLYSKNCV